VSDDTTAPVTAETAMETCPDCEQTIEPITCETHLDCPKCPVCGYCDLCSHDDQTDGS
jgi:hypothetical protein